MDTLGDLFPAGGRVGPEFMVGRVVERQEVDRIVANGGSPLVTGPRRSGKTTVLDAVRADVAADFVVLPRIEVPDKRVSCVEVYGQIVAACRAGSLRDEAGRIARVLRPMVDKYLADHGIPLDLAGFDAGKRETTRRDVLRLPLRLADEHDRRVLLTIDELQRVVECEDHEPLIGDLVDLYAGDRRVSALVSGSDDRGLELLAGGPVGKLVERYAIEARIPLQDWRPALVDRFALAGLAISEARVETILEFGRERPYETMLAGYHVADNALRNTAGEVDAFDVTQGLERARQRLRDEGRDG